MYAIKINDTYLDLDPRSSISVRMNNPTFDADNFPRVWTQPFRLQLTPTNQTALGFPDLINFAGTRRYKNATLYILGLPFESGEFIIKKASNLDIECVFKNLDLSVLESLEKIKINRILETIQVPQNVSPSTILSAAAPPDIYSLNVNNINFQLDATTGYNNPAQIAGYFSTEINAVFPNLTTVETPDRLIFQGSDYQVQIIEGWTVFSNNAVAVANQANMTDFVTDANSNGNTKVAFPTYYNASQYENNNPIFEGYINYYENGQLKQNTPQLTSQFEHTIVPFVRLPYIFERIVANSDLKAIAGAFYELADTQSLLLYSNYALDAIERYYDVSVAAFRFLNGYKSTIDLNQHVPELTAKEALNLFGFANVYFEVKGETLYLRKKIDQLLSPAIDWSKKSEPDYSIDFLERTGFSLEYPTDKTDTATRTNQLTEITLGDGVEPIVLPVGTVYEDVRSVFDDPDFFTWNVPFLKQKGSSDELQTGQNETGIKLLFDRGLRNNSRGNTYPFGTHKDVDYEGNTVGTYTLDWSGPTGLYESFWKQYLPLLQGDPITKRLRLSIQDILELRQWTNSRRTIRHGQGNLSGVIKSVDFQVSAEGIEVAEVEFIKE